MILWEKDAEKVLSFELPKWIDAFFINEQKKEKFKQLSGIKFVEKHSKTYMCEAHFEKKYIQTYETIQNI